MWGSLNDQGIPLCQKCGSHMEVVEQGYKCISCGNIHLVRGIKIERTHEDLGPRLQKNHEENVRRQPWD